MRRAAGLLAAALAACAGGPSGAPARPPFTRGMQTASAFGVHEIVLAGNGSAANPFETEAVVIFEEAASARRPTAVSAFYDGGDTWRARAYVEGPGLWRWKSACRSDPGLDGKSGEFTAVPSRLRGRLMRTGGRHWATEDRRPFLLLGDTAYYLLGGKDFRGEPIPDERFQKFVLDSAGRGVSAVRANALGSIRDPKWETIWADAARTRLELESFQRTDRRLRWILEKAPGLYVQMILFPEPNNGYGKDETFWKGLPPASRELFLRNVVARFAAYPQIFWQIANDVFHGRGFPNNDAWVREAGRYLVREPWPHPKSTGRNRRQPFPFPDDAWADYVHLEDVDQLAADRMELYRDRPMPVVLAEDRYETYIPPDDPRYYFRRLAWAWLLSGGSFMYGGRWAAVHPYSETGSLAYADPQKDERTDRRALVGLDSFGAIRRFFESRGIDLSLFAPDDGLAGGAGVDRPKLARRGFAEFIIYHPNAKGEGARATVDRARTARVALDLAPAPGAFAVEWTRAEDGASYDGGRVEGGARREFDCPWEGQDAVLRLVRAR